MTKHAFTTEMTAHVWAQRSQDSGYASGGSLRFDYDVLRAYSTVVAVLITDATGATRVIHREHVRSTGFAPNYGAIAQHAASQYLSHTVEDLDCFYSSTRERLDCRDEAVKRMLGKLLDSKIVEFRKSIKLWSNVNARKWAGAALRQNYVTESLANTLFFADAFGLSINEPLNDEAEKARVDIDARDAKAHDPLTVAKREKARASKRKRAERFDAEFNCWLEYGTNPPPWSAFIDDVSELRASDVKVTLDADARAFKGQDNFGDGAYVPSYAWTFTRPLRTFKTRLTHAQQTVSNHILYSRYSHSCNPDLSAAATLLYRTYDDVARAKLIKSLNLAQLDREMADNFDARNPDARKIVSARKCRVGRTLLTPQQWVDGAGVAYQLPFERVYVRRRDNRLETSLGAEAPFEHAVVIFLRAQRCMIERKGWRPNGEQFRAGFFALNSIDETGGINIGCHRIEYQEMLAVAVREIPQHVRQFPLALVA